jgi:hypothetical protein
VAVATVGVSLLIHVPLAFADTLMPGTVVVLGGTTHIWVADDEGVLHWAGDTRALAARKANWDSRKVVTLAQLLELPRGDPWLSAGLLKIGDPVYLVKWETSEAVPTLAHVRSIRDLELFGIDATNWGTFVYDVTLWERRFGLSPERLSRASLEPALAVPSVVAPALGSPAPTAPKPQPSSVGANPAVTAADLSLPGVAAAMSDAYRLNRTPIVRADGDLPFGTGEGWSEGISLDDRDHRMEVPYSSHILARWTIGSGATATYVRVASVNLDYNKDVSSNEALASKVFATYCRGTARCEGVSNPVGPTQVAGMPALRYETRTRIEYWTSPSGGGSNEFVQHEWLATHVFFIRGEWGYEVRVFSEHPSTFAVRSGEVLGVLSRVQFRKR